MTETLAHDEIVTMIRALDELPHDSGHTFLKGLFAYLPQDRVRRGGLRWGVTFQPVTFDSATIVAQSVREMDWAPFSGENKMRWARDFLRASLEAIVGAKGEAAPVASRLLALV